jgi:hypothetical protein
LEEEPVTNRDILRYPERMVRMKTVSIPPSYVPEKVTTLNKMPAKGSAFKCATELESDGKKKKKKG